MGERVGGPALTVLSKMIREQMIEKFFLAPGVGVYDTHHCVPLSTARGKKNEQNASKEGCLFWHVPSFTAEGLSCRGTLQNADSDVCLEKLVTLAQQVHFGQNISELGILNQL